MSRPADSMIFVPGPEERTVRGKDGKVIPVPEGWEFLAPGDAALTRRVKATGEFWLLQEFHRGRKISRGLWAPGKTIAQYRIDLDAERADPAYARRRQADAKRRDKAQAEYVEDFFSAIVEYLAFAPPHADLAARLARAVADHATPVGSGTVARTKRIPIERRAEAAVIAWMRHATTGYDSLTISRAAGQRREVRRMLAQRSKELLARYRSDQPIGGNCPLQRALSAGK